MPFIFLVIGILFLVLARNGTQNQFENLLKGEFTGNQSFLVFASAFVILGLIGFWKTARPVTDAFIGLIFFVLIVSNKGFFQKLNDGLRNPVAPPNPTTDHGAGPAANPAAQGVTVGGLTTGPRGNANCTWMDYLFGDAGCTIGIAAPSTATPQ